MLKKIITGGQTSAHRVRMFRQVLRIVFLVSLGVGLLCFGSWVIKEPKQNFFAAYHLCRSELVFSDQVKFGQKEWRDLSSNSKTPLNFRLDFSPKSQKKIILVDKTRAKKVCLKKAKLLANHALGALKRAGYFALISLLTIFSLFYFLGGLIRKNKHEKGSYLENWRKLAFNLKFSLRASDFKIGKIPIPIGSETSHFFVSGVSGSGKTNAIMQMLSQVRKRGNRAIIVDLTGDFIEKFYRTKQDIILNPYDKRSVSWNPWVECTKKNHFREIANAIFPLSSRKEENFFQTAARVVVQAALEKWENPEKRSVSSFVGQFWEKSLEDLHGELQSTKAAPYLDPKGEKTAHSILATVNNGIEGFSLLEDSADPFSVRDWILEEKEDDNWLFLSAKEDQRADLQALLSVWFSIAIDALKNRSKSFAKKNPIFLCIDELHALQKLECLSGGLAELRKYGGCLLLATQDTCQLDEVYGRNVASSIINNCGTKLCFRQTAMESAKRMSSFFGEMEFQAAQEGISYGAHQMRDGINLSSVEKHRPVISPSEIQNLPDLKAFLKLNNTARFLRLFPSKLLPATKISFKYKNFPMISEGCIEKEDFVRIPMEKVAKESGEEVKVSDAPKKSAKIEILEQSLGS